MRWLLRPPRIAILVFALLLVYTLVGFFLVPYLIKAYGIPAVAEKLQRPVLVKEVEFNPFKLALRLTGFEIRERDDAPLIGFDEFFVNLRVVSLIRRAYVFDTIRFTVPYVSVRVFKDGRVNLAELVPSGDAPEASPPAKDPDAPSDIPAIQIGQFEIAQGIVEFRDESKTKPVSIDIVPISIVLKNFHTKPGGDNTYAFTAELGKGETLDWKGTISLEPIRSEGMLSLSGVKIQTLFQYVQDRFNFDIPAGTIQAKGQYRFDATASPIDLVVTDTALHLADVRIVEKGDPEPVITIPALDIDGIDLDVNKRKMSIAAIALTNATDRAWLNPDHSVNLQALFAPVKPESAGSPPPSAPKSDAPVIAEPESSWSVAINNVEVTNHTIHFEDRSLAVPMRAEVTRLSATTHDFIFPLKGPIPLTVEHALNETGTVKVDGQIIATPFQLDMKVGLQHIALQPFQPYLDRFSRMAIDSGEIDLDGQIHLAVEHAREPLLTYRGNLGVRSLAIADRDQGSPVASWEQFQLSQIALDLDPTAVTIGEVGLVKPTVHLVVHSDGQLNVKKMFPSQEPPASAPETKPPPLSTTKSPSPTVVIHRVKLLKGTATFQDESIQPVVRTGLYDLTGTIKGLSSKQVAKADVNVTGKIDKVAPLKIAGQINPLSEDAFSDVAVTLQSMDLTPGGPYSGKYAGYGLSKGKLSLDLTYKVSKKQLEAENKVVVSQLTFGEKTNSPDATSLPVPLAVALLKDRTGQITIDLPIRGDLNDPDFKYGKVVLSTLLNLLTKLVTSPFTLMSKLVPGGGENEDFQHIEFAPGAAAFGPEQQKKMTAFVKALEERPGLRLEITGTADPVRDRHGVEHENALRAAPRRMAA